MDRPWFKHYPEGVPHEIDASIHGSLVDMLEEAFRRHAARPAAECLGSQLRFSDMDELS